MKVVSLCLIEELSRRTSIGIAGIWTDIRNTEIPNMNQDC